MKTKKKVYLISKGDHFLPDFEYSGKCVYTENANSALQFKEKEDAKFSLMFFSVNNHKIILYNKYED